jgi:hypothetical protein
MIRHWEPSLNQTELELNGKCHLLDSLTCDDISAFDENIHVETKTKNIEPLSDDGKKVGKEVKA